MNKTLQIQIKNFDLQDSNNPDFAIVKIMAISEGLNSNNSIFTLESMQSCKDTFLGKPLMAAFPKDYVKDNYKMGDGHNTDLKYDEESDTLYYSYLDPDSERCVGYILPNQEIKIENINGQNWITMNALIFKKYNYELLKDILSPNKPDDIAKNSKRVSVEIDVLDSNFDNDTEILNKWSGDGITILGNDVLEGIKGASLTLKTYAVSPKFARFRQALSFAYKHRGEENIMETFISKDKLGTSPALKVDKSKKALSTDDWGNVDKSQLKKDCLMASNYKTVCQSAFLQLLDGWEEGKEGSLKYPVMQKKGDTLVYNEKALSSALGYAKKNNETEVVSKANAIRKKLGLDNKEEESSMKKYINEAKKHGYVFMGAYNNELLFAKEEKCEKDDVSNKEKMSVYGISKEKCDDENDFNEEDMKQKDIKMDKATPKDNKKEIKDSDEYKGLEKQCNSLKEKKEKAEKDKEDMKQKYEKLNKDYEDMKSKKEKAEKDKEDMAKKCSDMEEKEAKEKAKKYAEEANAVFTRKDLGLPEDSLNEVKKMSEEGKFSSIQELKKEIGGRQFELREKLNANSNSLNMGLDNMKSFSANLGTSKGDVLDVLDNINKNLNK